VRVRNAAGEQYQSVLLPQDDTRLRAAALLHRARISLYDLLRIKHKRSCS
jgi:hypothetical protein